MVENSKNTGAVGGGRSAANFQRWKSARNFCKLEFIGPSLENRRRYIGRNVKLVNRSLMNGKT